MGALERAIRIVGGGSALAAAIGTSASSPAMWRRRKCVPAKHCPAIERETRARGEPVPCEELRPDVAWGVLRQHPAPVAQPWRGEADVHGEVAA